MNARAATHALSSAQAAEPLPTPTTWVAPACVCGAENARLVLPVTHVDAPDGRAAIVACVCCGLQRLTPRPREEHAGTYYASEYNAFVGRRRGRLKQALWTLARDVAARRPGPTRALAVLRPLARWAFDVSVALHASPPDVLEVGCGYGDLLHYLRARGCRVTGVDLDPRAVAKARADGLDVRRGPLRDLALSAEHYDVAVLCHSLEHIADPAAELREIARLLRPGGLLHVAVPNGRAAAFALEGESWEHASVPLHLWFFDTATLTDLLGSTGFDVIAPAVASSSYRPLARWVRELTDVGLVAATRTLVRTLAARVCGRGGGDVVRVVARRR